MYTYLKFGLPRVMPPGVEEVGVHSVPIRAGDPGVAAWCHHRGTTHPWPGVGCYVPSMLQGPGPPVHGSPSQLFTLYIRAHTSKD